MVKKYILIALIILIVSSCKKESERKEFYPNGQLKLKFSLIQDSIPHDPFVSYFETGEIESKGKYEAGLATDTLYRYFKNGIIKEKGVLKENLKVGWWRYYKINGELKSREEYIILNDSMHRNQSISYYDNGAVDLGNSSFFELQIKDTIPIGKSLGKVKHYVSNFKAHKKYLYVVVDNEYQEGIIKKDTFRDGNFTPGIGIFGRKIGSYIVKGTIVEQLVINDIADSALYIKEHYKYFEKEVYVRDTILN